MRVRKTTYSSTSLEILPERSESIFVAELVSELVLLSPLPFSKAPSKKAFLVIVAPTVAKLRVRVAPKVTSNVALQNKRNFIALVSEDHE